MPPLVEWKLRSKSCWCYIKNSDGAGAVDQCTKAIKIREDVEILCNRAEAYLLSDLFSEGKHNVDTR